MTRRLRLVPSLLVSLVLVTLPWPLAPSLATAQDAAAPPADGEGEAPASEFDRLVMEAAEAYGNRNYAKALELFEQAYAIEAVPDLLYNMGLIADRMGDFDRGLKYLNQFVLSPDIDLDAREDALKRIEQLKQLQALQSPKEPDPVIEPPKEPDKDAKGPAELPPEPPPEPDYIGPGIVLGVGLATLAAGGVTAGLALAEHDAFEEAQSIEDRREAADTGETLALVSDILLPTGGALAVAGIIWLAVEATSTESAAAVDAGSESAVELSPSVSPEGVGLNLSVDF